jgi:cold shock protein
MGTISFFHAGKGYGFISRPDGDDLFVHASNVLMEGRPVLDVGRGVTFGVRDGKRGPEAFDVAPV